MKAVVCCLIVFFAVPNNNFGQDDSIKYIKEVCYKAENKYGKVIRKEKGWYFEYLDDHYSKFNREGTMAEFGSLNEQGDTLYKYLSISDNDFNIQKTISWSTDNDSLELDYHCYYYYDVDGYDRVDTSFNKDGEYKWHTTLWYDQFNKLDRRKTTYADGEVMFSHVTYYVDSIYNYIEEEYNADSVLRQIDYIRYDTTQNTYSVLQLKVKYNGDKDTNLIIFKEYDDYDREAHLRYDKRSNWHPEKREMFFEYEMDDRKNWIMKYVYNQDKILRYVVYREIIYWD